MLVGLNKMEVEKTIRERAIQNRLQYGRADEKAVIGKVLSEIPEAKRDMRALIEKVKAIISEVNQLPLDELDGHELRMGKTVKGSSLKLPGKPAAVVMRFAPNPNGPATLGSARGIVVNSELARRYGGEFILRFDDTDPKTKKPMMEAYGWYLEDCEWLDAKPDDVYYASDRIQLYYEHAEKLITGGHAYVCFCSKSDFKALRDKKMKCPHRDSQPEKNIGFWRKMLAGEYNEGECVLRIKTDIEHKDPALRDWVGFRIIQEPHPRVGDKYVVWPMLDFESAIEDHLLGITHIIRGKDLIDSEHRQRFIYGYLGWEYPVTMHWGRVRLVEFGAFSTSKLKEMISRGEYSGWDDPRVPTIRALRRRGVSPEAVRNLMTGLGISEVDVSISLENLFAENRKVMDPKANRYFFIEDPKELVVRNAPQKEVRIPLHPSFRERGMREFQVNTEDGNTRLFISAADSVKLRAGDEVRLMNLFNVRITGVNDPITADYLEGENLRVNKIHWLQDYLPAEVLRPEGWVGGFCEPACGSLDVGEVVQFERFGFVRLDRKAGSLVFYFGHR
ncbi:MAG: glutamate--tRNA ligase [Candidatus Altiarchaeota archaeon]|nr:glutamate--tRNA ligase [Candidatus Altiarchaeota archaeon]